MVQDDDCAATSGNWVSPYDGATWTAASDLDIDHIVPLSNAWKVGVFDSIALYIDIRDGDKLTRNTSPGHLTGLMMIEKPLQMT